MPEGAASLAAAAAPRSHNSADVKRYLFPIDEKGWKVDAATLTAAKPPQRSPEAGSRREEHAPISKG